MPDASPLAADRTLLVLPVIVEAKPLTTDLTLSPMSPTGVFRLVFMEPDNACDSGCHADNHLLRGISKGPSAQGE